MRHRAHGIDLGIVRRKDAQRRVKIWLAYFDDAKDKELNDALAVEESKKLARVAASNAAYKAATGKYGKER